MSDEASTPPSPDTPPPPLPAPGTPDLPPAPTDATAPRNGMGTAALVLGIIGLVLACAFGVGTIFAIIAIVLGAIGLKNVKKGVASNRGSALAGTILGIAGLVVGTVVVIFVVLFSLSTAPPTSSLDPDNNSKTGLADGQYSLQVTAYFLYSDQCSYTGTPVNLDTQTAAGSSVTVVGLDESVCGYSGLETGAVYFDVSGGEAEVVRVE